MSNELSRRSFVTGLAVAAATVPALGVGAEPAVSTTEMAVHEKYMRLAIAQAKLNPGRPFGSVLVDNHSGEVVGKGVVAMSENPTYHSEMVAMNDYVAHHGTRDWGYFTMYGTGEACPMCMSAMVWAGVPRVVYGSDMPFVAKFVNLINIRATDVVAAANPKLYTSKLLLGGVLSSVTDKMFEDRAKAQANPR